MPFNFRDVRRSLTKKGFVEDLKRHHIYFYHEYRGRRTGPYTYIPHGKMKEDAGPDIERAMKQQLSLRTTHDVRRLVGCPMDGAEYLEILEEKGVLTPTTRPR